MSAAVNDSLRWLISRGIWGLGLALETSHRARIRTFQRQQERLRQRYGIDAQSPILPYGPEIEALIRQASARAGKPAGFALTSGSTAAPKRILYPRRRLWGVRWTFMEVFCRAFRALPVRRTSLFVFSPAAADQSLTAMLLAERRPPPYLSTLQAPYRVQSQPAIRALATRYGATAVRLWLLALANPGVLYSTNPSTLSTFLDEVAADWARSSHLAREWVRDSTAFDAAVRKTARRIVSRGAEQRLAQVAASERPLPLRAWAPGVEAYSCWSGGYVQPFLDRLAFHLPPERYRLIPMYSMSTETIETVSHFEDGEVAFLPLAPGVLYEFIAEGEEDRVECVRTPGQLQVGKAYALVASDAFGLRRYQTGDLFFVQRFVVGLPDLRFLRRRGLEYSFTGEKLTAEQLSAVFRQLREECGVAAGDFLTCIPSQPPDEPVPHYKILIVGDADRDGPCLRELARRCETLLGEQNAEYASKRQSGRLGPVRCLAVRRREFVERIAGAGQRESWEGQFKFLPLYQRTWEAGERESGA
jgi:hypothetical protein